MLNKEIYFLYKSHVGSDIHKKLLTGVLEIKSGKVLHCIPHLQLHIYIMVVSLMLCLSYQGRHFNASLTCVGRHKHTMPGESNEYYIRKATFTKLINKKKLITMFKYIYFGGFFFFKEVFLT